MPNVAFYTLGCKVNQYESDAMAQLFLKSGYNIVDFNSTADIYVINTCDVTNESARKSRQMIRKAHRKNPKAKIAVVGCYSQLKPEEVSALPGVAVVIGTKARHRIVDLIEEFKVKNNQIITVGDIMEQKEFEDIAQKGFRQKTRAFLKIQEGCNMFCSYCIIPYARGPLRSRPMESIIEEAENLVKDGFKEIVLTGIHLGLYGKDFKEENLHLLDVIANLSKIDGIKRIRLSSIEALELTDDFIQSLSQLDVFCHHFHIPLQSGSDSVLKRMNRRYTAEEFKDRVELIRKKMPDVSITTDVIVGFPGETEQEFEQTVDFIEKIKFSKLHVFPFSPRDGTPASKMPNPVKKSIKDQRTHKLIEVGKKLEMEFREQFLGKVAEVLFEEKSNTNSYEGLTGNYIKVIAYSDENVHNEIRQVRLIENQAEHVLCEII